jgi:multiple sugar transport system substrate-binding protein
MTREELLRILSFVDSSRELSEDRTQLATVDPRWNIVSFAMRRHLEGKLLTVTTAAAAAEVPYGTAMRRISELIDEGFLLKRPKSKSGKSFSLHPTSKLIAEFESFAMQLKAMVGRTFGFTEGDGEISDFYFGGYYMASRILPYPNAMRSGVGYDKTIRILSPIDPTFKTLSQFSVRNFPTPLQLIQYSLICSVYFHIFE